MTTLVNPRYPADHPRQVLHELLCDGMFVVWFSETASDRTVFHYVAKLLGQSVGLLRVTSEGFGLTPDEKVLIVTMRNDRGSAVCLIPVARGGADKTNAAMQNEGDAMREALSRGEYVGNEADCRNAAISNGAVHPELWARRSSPS